MKKSVLLLGLLITTVCLTACGSKKFDMSFDEALEIASHSAFQDILSENENFEQNFEISGNLDIEETKIDANISSNSKQNTNSNTSESSTKFDANISTSGENANINGSVDIKTVDNTIYLNLSTLDITGSDNLSMLGMMVEGIKGQWLSISATGLSEMPNTLSYLQDSKELNAKAKEIIVNEGSIVYSGKFSQFNGYNAWKISLDNDKLNELIKEFYDTTNVPEDEESEIEIPRLNIQNFEGYFVITAKDKVTIVIENMDMQEENTVITANGFAGEDYEINLYNGEEPIVTITAQKKTSKYEISANIANSLYLNGSISPKLSKSEINLGFNATLTIKSEYEGNPDTVIPLKGSRNYKSISEFSVTAPTDAKDFSELLGGLFGAQTLDIENDPENIDNNLRSLEIPEGNIEENTEIKDAPTNESSEANPESNETNTENE